MTCRRPKAARCEAPPEEAPCLSEIIPRENPPWPPAQPAAPTEPAPGGAARRLLAVVVLGTMSVLDGCGGRSGPESEPTVSVALRAEVSDQGTKLECAAERPLAVTLARDGVAQRTLDCPFMRRLAADWRLSEWELRAPSGEALATSASRLRAPLVLGLPSATYVLKDAHARGLTSAQLRVRARLASGLAAMKMVTRLGRSPERLVVHPPLRFDDRRSSPVDAELR